MACRPQKVFQSETMSQSTVDVVAAAQEAAHSLQGLLSGLSSMSQAQSERADMLDVKLDATRRRSLKRKRTLANLRERSAKRSRVQQHALDQAN